MGYPPALRQHLGGARPSEGRRRYVLGALGAVAGFGVAVVVAVAWVPLRTGQPNIEIGLLLVVVVTAVGLGGRRGAVVTAALGAAVSFTYFDTEPYDHFTISRQPDVVTAVGLIVVGLITGELALRVARQRRDDRSATGDLTRIREASSLLASGEELVVMIGSVAQNLQRQLHLNDCWFAAEAIPDATLVVQRDGTLRRSTPDAATPVFAALHAIGVGPRIPARPPKPQPELSTDQEMALPVWALGEVVGHFVLQVTPGANLGRDRLQVAVTLADQVGASLAAQAPMPPAPLSPPPLPNLRVIH